MAVEAAVQIKLVRENLALAIALWGAAQRGVITAGFVPNRSEFLTANGLVVKVSAPLEVHDTQELVRCVNNQVRGAFVLSVMQTNRVLESIYGNSPIKAADSDVQAARCALYLLSKSVSQNMMTPVWDCPPDYRRKFDVEFASFSLDASQLDGKNVCWDDFGGLEKYLDLLEFCGVEVNGHSGDIAELDPELTTTGEVPGVALAGEVEEPEHPAEAPGAALAKPAEGSSSVEVVLPPESSGDSVSKFVDGPCTISPQEMIIAKDLYDAYSAWCHRQGEEAEGQRSFGMRLTAMGFQRKRRGRGRHWWLGIGLGKPVSV